MPLELEDILEVKALTDLLIGKDYYSYMDLARLHKNGLFKKTQLSFVIKDKNTIVGCRLTLAPGTWIDSKKVDPNSWDVNNNDNVAYFQSVFLKKEYMGKGMGSKVSKHVLNLLRNLKVEAVVCHSHLESINNSSQKYLLKLGFQNLNTYQDFWKEVDYDCSTCCKETCVCSASEMIYYLEDK